jgi:hypothetical protein
VGKYVTFIAGTPILKSKEKNSRKYPVQHNAMAQEQMKRCSRKYHDDLYDKAPFLAVQTVTIPRYSGQSY